MSCYKGSMNAVVNNSYWICNEMLLNIGAKEFFRCCNKKFNADKNFGWNTQKAKQTKGIWFELDGQLCIIFVNEQHLRKDMLCE